MSLSCMARCRVAVALHTPPRLPVIATLDHHTACSQPDFDNVLPGTLPAALANMPPWSANLLCPYALTVALPALFPAIAVCEAADHAVPTALTCTHRPLHWGPCYPTCMSSQACPLPHWRSLHLQC